MSNPLTSVKLFAATSPVVLTVTEFKDKGISPFDTIVSVWRDASTCTLPLSFHRFGSASLFVHAIVLFVAPKRVIPPPSAVRSVGVGTLPSSMLASSIWITVESKYVVVPLTVRSPDTTTPLALITKRSTPALAKATLASAFKYIPVSAFELKLKDGPLAKPSSTRSASLTTMILLLPTL
jgi:hypothetical protein